MTTVYMQISFYIFFFPKSLEKLRFGGTFPKHLFLSSEKHQWDQREEIWLILIKLHFHFLQSANSINNATQNLERKSYQIFLIHIFSGIVCQRILTFKSIKCFSLKYGLCWVVTFYIYRGFHNQFYTICWWYTVYTFYIFIICSFCQWSKK